jgi:hypothetical protein
MGYNAAVGINSFFLLVNVGVSVIPIIFSWFTFNFVGVAVSL